MDELEKWENQTSLSFFYTLDLQWNPIVEEKKKSGADCVFCVYVSVSERDQLKSNLKDKKSHSWLSLPFFLLLVIPSSLGEREGKNRKVNLCFPLDGDNDCPMAPALIGPWKAFPQITTSGSLEQIESKRERESEVRSFQNWSFPHFQHHGERFISFPDWECRMIGNWNTVEGKGASLTLHSITGTGVWYRYYPIAFKSREISYPKCISSESDWLWLAIYLYTLSVC